MMPLPGLGRCRIVALEELIERCFLKTFFLGLWVERFHFIQFFLRELRQMADKMHQPPAIEIFFRVAAAPSRHGCEANAVVNDPKQLTVGHGLGLSQPQIGRLRVDVLPDRRLAASVVPMADGAMIRKMCSPLFENVGVQRDGVGGIALFDRNGQMANLPCHQDLQGVGFRLCAEPCGEQLVTDPAEKAEADNDDNDDGAEQFRLHNPFITIQTPKA